jgi:GTP-binding protein HflX
VESILRELHIEDKPVIRVFNKQDRFPDRMLLQTLCRRYQATAISALQPESLAELLTRLEAGIGTNMAPPFLKNGA